MVVAGEVEHSRDCQALRATCTEASFTPFAAHHSLASTITQKLRLRYLHATDANSVKQPVSLGKVLQKMDDPDVDHDLIAFMRETLTLSNKAQDTISSDTGKAKSLGTALYARSAQQIVSPCLYRLRRKICAFKAPMRWRNVTNSVTGVLKDAEHIAYNAIDVAISMYGTRDAANSLYKAMCERKYSTQTWSEHELHPKLGIDVNEVGLVNFVFTLDQIGRAHV